MSIKQQFRDSIENIISKTGETRLLAAVSGGADSICMLHLLDEIRGSHGLEILVAHVNHLIREEAGDDAAYVAEIAEAWGFPYQVAVVDVPAIAQAKKLSLEHAARVARYSALAQIAEAHDIRIILTAHNQDDQIETILMNLFRGSGLDGASGMRMIASLNQSHLLDGLNTGLIIGRPMLEINREEITITCVDMEIHYRDDKTNEDTHYRRNLVRHMTLPAIEKDFPHLRRSILNFGRIASGENAFIEKATCDFIKEAIINSSDHHQGYRRERFLSLPLAIQRRILRSSIRELKGNTENLSLKHIDDALDFLKMSERGKIFELPMGMRILHDGDAFIICNREYVREYSGPLLPDLSEITLPQEGATDLPETNWYVLTKLTDSRPAQPELDAIFEDSLSAIFDADEIHQPLILRTRRDGDSFFPFGYPGRKKIGDFMTDQKVPTHIRGGIPLLTTGEKIIWVVGFRVDDETIITEQTRRFLMVSLRKI